MPPDPPRGYRLRRAFIRTPLRQILDPPQGRNDSFPFQILLFSSSYPSAIQDKTKGMFSLTDVLIHQTILRVLRRLTNSNKLLL